MDEIARGERPMSLLFGVYQSISLSPKYPCEIASVRRGYRKIANGMVFQKGWPFTR